MKKKSIVKYGTHISGKRADVHMLPHGPFGNQNTTNSVILLNGITTIAPVGFSINGPHRNVGGVGKTYQMSKSGTPYKGIYAKGYGGHLGKYTTPPPVLNILEVNTKGSEFMYNKMPVLSTRGNLRNRFKWAYSGQYPNYWVQPQYGSGNLSLNASQGEHIRKLSTKCDIHDDVNNVAKYAGNMIDCNQFCSKPAPYTKTIYRPLDQSEYIHRLTRPCLNPTPEQEPFPFAVNGDSCGAPYQLTPNGTDEEHHHHHKHKHHHHTT